MFQRNEQFVASALDTGFHLVNFRAGLEQYWIDVLNESGEFGKWDMRRLSQFLLSDLLPGGGVLVFNHDHKPVACSAICLKKELEPFAVLMYVLVLPGYRGRGLSVAMIIDGLKACCQQGFPGVTLLTDDSRLPAINIYLKLGFRADMTMSSDAPERWEKIFAQLDTDKK